MYSRRFCSNSPQHGVITMHDPPTGFAELYPDYLIIPLQLIEQSLLGLLRQS